MSIVCSHAILTAVCFIWVQHSFQQSFSHITTVWMWQGAKCFILDSYLTEIACCRHMIFQAVTLYRHHITKTCLYKYMYIGNFTTKKTQDFSDKISDIFHISAQNIDCGYSLEPPHRGGSNEYPQPLFWAEIRKIMYAPVNPSFTI